MRSRTFAILVVGSCAAAGCGGGATFANLPRPPTPVNLSVYVNDARVSVSPASVGAGPVIFIVTNAASTTESVNIESAGGERTLGTTGPINPQATAQVTVDMKTGDYTVATAKNGTTEASQFVNSPIRPAKIHIGHPRPSASDQLLQP
jgi:hypothetical protein